MENIDGPLFPDKSRSDARTIRPEETHYGFLDRVDDPTFERIRLVLNVWFDRFKRLQSEEAASDLRGRLQAKQGGQLESAFWELYLHEACSRLGFDIEVHPESERGKRPDFDLTREGRRTYLEAVAPRPSLFDRDEPRSVDSVIEYVDEAFDPKWRLSLCRVCAGKNMPRKADVRSAVLGWLETLDWEAARRRSLADGPNPEGEVRVADWLIVLRAMPMPPEKHDSEPRPMIWLHRAIARYPEALGPAIVPLLTEKANKYGDLDAPLVLAVWVRDLLADAGTVPLALFGITFEDHMNQDTARIDLSARTTRSQSLWAPNAMHRGRASAALAADGFSFGYPAIARTLPRLWVNPWADRPLEVDLPFATSRVSENELALENKPSRISAAGLFELSNDWPGQPSLRGS